jgi:hypothetical protein
VEEAAEAGADGAREAVADPAIAAAGAAAQEEGAGDADQPRRLSTGRELDESEQDIVVETPEDTGGWGFGMFGLGEAAGEEADAAAAADGGAEAAGAEEAPAASGGEEPPPDAAAAEEEAAGGAFGWFGFGGGDEEPAAGRVVH